MFYHVSVTTESFCPATKTNRTPSLSAQQNQNRYFLHHYKSLIQMKVVAITNPDDKIVCPFLPSYHNKQMPGHQTEEVEGGLPTGLCLE